jgi:hypothetical protein
VEPTLLASACLLWLVVFVIAGETSLLSPAIVERRNPPQNAPQLTAEKRPGFGNTQFASPLLAALRFMISSSAVLASVYSSGVTLPR